MRKKTPVYEIDWLKTRTVQDKCRSVKPDVRKLVQSDHHIRQYTINKWPDTSEKIRIRRLKDQLKNNS